jgi:hypothetical protein
MTETTEPVKKWVNNPSYRFGFNFIRNEHLICNRVFPIFRYKESIFTNTKAIMNDVKGCDLDNIDCITAKLDSMREDFYGADFTPLNELMNTLMGMNIGQIGYQGVIPKYLKKLANEYMWSNYNEHEVQLPEDIERYHSTRPNDVYTLELLFDDRVICRSSFNDRLLPPRVKTGADNSKTIEYIDIREIIPEIIQEIRSTFTA